MSERFERFGVIVLDSGLASFTLLILASVAILWSRQPARRLVIARTAMSGVLAVPLLIGLGLVPRFDVSKGLSRIGVSTHPVLTPILERIATPLHAWMFPAHWTLRGVSAIYLFCVAAGFSWLILGYVAVFLLKRKSKPASPFAVGLFDELVISRHVRKPVLRVSTRIRGPMLVGTFRPWVIIPQDLDAPGEENRSRLTLCFLHELAHVQAADPWFGLVENLVRILWFFLPPYWWISAQVRLDKEFLADRTAAVDFGPLPSYAGALLDVVAPRDISNAASPLAKSHVGAPKSPLHHRILMLIRCPYPVEFSPPRLWGLSATGLMVALTIGVSTLAFRLAPSRPAIAPETHQFFLGKLELPATPSPLEGRVGLFNFPVLLPEHFQLSMEVWGDLSSLARLKVVGLVLQSPIQHLLSEPRMDREAWHRVEITSDRGILSLRIDGADVELLDPESHTFPTLTPALSLEAVSSLPSFIQNLDLKW